MTSIADLAPGDRVIIISRVLDAPRDLVFEAFTDPEHLAQFWGPKGFTTTRCAIDLRVGGEFRIDLRGPDGVDYPCVGTYREIAPPERIVYAGTADEGHPCGAGLPPQSVVTMTFVPVDGKTKITIHAQMASVEARDAAVEHGFRQGWEDSLDRIAEWIANCEPDTERQRWLEQQRAAIINLLDQYRSDAPPVRRPGKPEEAE